MKNKRINKKYIGAYFLVVLNLCGMASAQITHDVTVSNFQFTPSKLVIAVGDIVKWTNTEGTHNVDGTIATNATNPESFGNSSGAPGWTYSFTFNMAGVYNYNCSVHGASMSGKITVGNVTSKQDNTSALSSKKAYPNPASDVLYIPLSTKASTQDRNLKLNIYNLGGKSVVRKVSAESDLLQVNINELQEGLYFFELSDADKIVGSGKFVKQK